MSEDESTMKWTERVRAILAKAEDPATTPEERDAFLAGAAKLIAKHGIDAALLANEGKLRDEVGDMVIRCDAPWAMEKIRLLAAICEAMRVRVVLKSRKTTAKELHLFGFQSDLERVDLLWASLLTQAVIGLAGAVNTDPWMTDRVFHRGWWGGFTSAVKRRLMEAEQGARTTAMSQAGTVPNGPGVQTNSVALVLRTREMAVADAVKATYPKTSPGRATSYRSGGWGAGQAAGRQADIGQRGMGGGRTAIGR